MMMKQKGPFPSIVGGTLLFSANFDIAVMADTATIHVGLHYVNLIRYKSYKL